MKRLLLVLVGVALVSPVWATTGTVSVSRLQSGGIERVAVSLTSDNAGTAYLDNAGQFAGQLVRVSTVPSSGATSPSAAWDVTVTDPVGLDVLLAGGADRSATAVESFAPCLTDQGESTVQGVPLAVLDVLTVRADNMGSTNSVTLLMYLRR